jgi:ParB-like chromosome segregation protein Spo0J
MKSQKVKIAEVKANPNNPRVIKDDKFAKLVQSIKDFPKMLEIRPIVVNRDMIVLGGNMRLRACKEAGLKEVSIIMAEDLTEEQQKEFIIKDNVSGGEWDWSMLANEWDAEELDNWGLDIPNFDTDLEKEQKDLSSTIDNLYRIEIVCKDEEHQENTYNKLIEQGHECRLLTL